MTRALFLPPCSYILIQYSATTWTFKNVLAAFVGIFILFGLQATAKEPPDGHDLVARSLAAGEKNEELLRAYVSRTRSDSRQYETDGSLKSEEVKTFDDVVVDGFHVRKWVAKNDKPLAGADQQKEDIRIANLISQRKRETASARDQRLTEAKEKRDKDHRFSHELLEAFDYQVVGQEELNGRRSWVLEAVPHPGYKPKELKAQIFTHLRGRIWIDEQELLWVKADARAVEPFAIGFSALAKLDQGAHLFFEQMRLPDGTWVTGKIGVKANVRLAMVKHIAIEKLTTSDSFRKVPPDTRLADTKDAF